MARKIEDWNDIFPNQVRKLAWHKGSAPREAIIEGCAALDVGLVHLIEKRLLDKSSEVEDFMGLDEDGRAPLGSFGARIQLAYLLGLIGEEDLRMLRALKAIRNRFAHRVNLELTDEKVLNQVAIIFDYIKGMYRGLTLHPELKKTLDDWSKFRSEPAAARVIILSGITCGHFINHMQLEKVVRLEPIAPMEWKPDMNPGG